MADKQQYANVSDLVQEMAPDSEFRAAFEERRAARQLIKQLLTLRAASGLSQQDIAGRIDCTQSRVSKLENSRDDDIRLGDLRAYARAIGCELVVGAMPHLSPVDKVKGHLSAIKKHTDDLAELARSDDKIAQGVAHFFFDLVFDFSRLVGDSAKLLPKNPNDLPYFDFSFQVDVVAAAAVSTTVPTTP
jgi:transcriptional regulator with XRE-family HTH domain